MIEGRCSCALEHQGAGRTKRKKQRQRGGSSCTEQKRHLSRTRSAAAAPAERRAFLSDMGSQILGMSLANWVDARMVSACDKRQVACQHIELRPGAS